MEQNTPNTQSNDQTNKADKSGRGRPAGPVAMQSVEKGDKKLAYSSDVAPAGASAAAGQGGQGGRGGPGDRKRGSRPSRDREKPADSNAVEQVIRISRVAKVTKGGTKLSFTALVVTGDAKGNVGYALGKAAEVSIAIKKGMNAAKKNMVKINVYGTTIPHQVIGGWCATRVLLKPAGDGTGVIASGAVRAICDGAGIKNILTKIHRSSNPLNVVKATFDGLSQLKKRQAPVVAETK